ncbi:Thiol-specific monooxygenase [Leucoagaricus sp. SymC.cos]|nr:Thiol-specific monooxygenase [Leucoagaricus sp. SymC.cos]
MSAQTSLEHSSSDAEPSLKKAYEFKWPVKRVAVIGAGVAGLTAYRELKEDGFDVHVFERDNLPGGNWHYTDEISAEAPVPNAPIAVADFEPSLPPQGVDLPHSEEYDDEALCALHRRDHRKPKPIWHGLDFDGVVVATGCYTTPNMPPIPGLAEWAKAFPGSVLHSSRYRRQQMVAGRKVLMVGAGSSGSQISREIAPHADKIYQSVRVQDPSQRPTIIDWVRTIPQNVSIVAEIKSFHSPGSTIQETAIELVDGTILTGIDYVLFSTGFLQTYPFLPEYINPSLGRTGEAPEDAPIKPIITDGTHVRSLHLDTFYIDNPTLTFVNANLGISSFTYGYFQAFAISMVWSGKAQLPKREEMWRLYRERVKEIGYGKQFSIIGGRRSQKMVRYFRGWLNAAAAKSGGRQINGLPIVYVALPHPGN